MATVRTCGFACKFVEKPPRVIQTQCPLCQQILCEPYQAPCCGNNFCRVCKERIKTDNKPCPTCKEENFVTFYNKGLEISFYKFHVYCSHKQEGCEWKGELGQLDNHLKECEYSEIECIYCSELIKHCNIAVHQTDLCPKRQIRCEYCHGYESHYEDVVNNHWPVCGYHPVQCPKGCGTCPQRQSLENHVTRDCPKTVIDCEFYHVGCNVRLPRKDMPAHLNENLVTHMSLQAASYNKQLASQSKLLTALQEKVNKLESENETLKRQLETTQQAAGKVQQMEQQIATLQMTSKAETTTVQQIMKHLKVQTSYTVNITMNNYLEYKRGKRIWYSEPFYTHPRGFKLCLQVHANGFGDGEGTHVSVGVRLMRGEFDDHLTWPFQGEIVIQILSKVDNNTQQKTIVFDKMVPETCTRRVTQGEISQRGCTFHQFMSHVKVERHYFRNNCLYFHITCKKTY